MKTIALLASLLLVASTVQDPHKPPEPTEQHKWLQQLVGEWSCTVECSMGPGTEPQKFESSESCRAVGSTWVVSEGNASFEGKPFSSMLTIGYDPAKKTFVGSYIDTMQTHLWTYRGTLDAAKKVLTLEAEGPSCEDPSKTCSFRDAFEIVGPDHKRMTSTMKGDDGKWTQFMSADFKRKK